MARKSRFIADVREEKKSAVLLAGIYTRLSIEDEDDEEDEEAQNPKG